jgi:glycosyltransferase involved in cell wall biosynthesis
VTATPLRVCVSPGPAANLDVRRLCDALVTHGCEIDALTVKRLFGRRYDVVHVHWPEWWLRERPYPKMVWRCSLLIAGVVAAQVRGARFVWTAHNLVPHEPTPRRASRAFWWAIECLLDGVISPSTSGLRQLEERSRRVGRLPTAVIPIGHLRGEYPDHGSRSLARRRLAVDPTARVATFFGLIRPYKGVAPLVRAFHDLVDDDVLLLVAGRPSDDEVRHEIEVAASDDPRIRLTLRYIEDEAVQDFLRAADVVVLPYVQTTNSFAALLALSFGRPVLAPRRGVFSELAEVVGPQWVRLYDDGLTASTLEAALTASAVGRAADVPDLGAFEWDGIGRSTRAFYDHLGSA